MSEKRDIMSGMIGRTNGHAEAKMKVSSNAHGIFERCE